MSREYEKVYLIFKKSNKSLYAFTKSKKQMEAFIEQRSIKFFKVKKTYMTNEDYDIFKKDNSKCILTDTIVSDNEIDLELISTYGEDYILTEKCDLIEHDMNQIYNNLVVYTNFGDIITDAVVYLTTGGKIKHNFGETIEIQDKLNTFSIFINIFKETFKEN